MASACCLPLYPTPSEPTPTSQWEQLRPQCSEHDFGLDRPRFKSQPALPSSCLWRSASSTFR